MRHSSKEQTFLLWDLKIISIDNYFLIASDGKQSRLSRLVISLRIASLSLICPQLMALSRFADIS